MRDIDSLYRQFDNCELCRDSGNSLQHILGGGKKNKPDVALVFINPTHTNIGASPQYSGKRFPFLGVNHFWKVFSDAGWFDDDLVESLKGWKQEEVDFLNKKLHSKGVYITNLIKCTFPHGNYPDDKYFEYHNSLFEEEMKIVKPESIVTFGVLTTKIVGGDRLTFKEYFKDPTPLMYDDLDTPVYPCYFPVGRGNPKKASEVLGELRYLIE